MRSETIERLVDKHGIEPVGIMKAVRDLTDELKAKAIAEPDAEYRVNGVASLPRKEMERVISELEANMRAAAKNLEFERAALLRDQLYELRNVLAEEGDLKPWERIKVLAGQDDEDF